MLLSEIIAESELTLRQLADRFECSHNHLSQCANLKKALSTTLALRIKDFDDRFSIEQQHIAFQNATKPRQPAAAAARQASRVRRRIAQ